MRANLHHKWQQMGQSLTDAQSQTRLIRDANWLACLGPNSLSHSLFRPLTFLLIQPGRLNHIMSWGRSVLGQRFGERLQHQGALCLLMKNMHFSSFSESPHQSLVQASPALLNLNNLEEVECHLRGPHRISTLVLENLKKISFSQI